MDFINDKEIYHVIVDVYHRKILKIYNTNDVMFAIKRFKSEFPDFTYGDCRFGVYKIDGKSLRKTLDLVKEDKHKEAYSYMFSFSESSMRF